MRKLMPRILFLALTIVMITGYSFINDQKVTKDPSQTEVNLAIMDDSTPKVTGIGGIFFRTKDPKGLGAWYGENLGLAIDDYGSAFEFRNANRPDEINYLRWGPFDEATDYFEPSKKEFMINYRVQHIEALVEQHA